MPDPQKSPDLLLRSLAEFRYSLRRFLQFSEQAAIEAGLHPRQHQLLLQLVGAPPDALPNVAYVAERLSLKHNSAVELVDRSEREGLVTREEDFQDRRRTILRVTHKGRAVLDSLADIHARELLVLGPLLIQSLQALEKTVSASRA